MKAFWSALALWRWWGAKRLAWSLSAALGFLTLLDGALHKDPHDSDVLQERGAALWSLGRQ